MSRPHDDDPDDPGRPYTRRDKQRDDEAAGRGTAIGIIACIAAFLLGFGGAAAGWW